MAKFYVKSGANRRICMGKQPIDAAIASVSTWIKEKRKMGTSVRVSEVGFDGDHPHHENDVVIPAAFVKKKIKR